jgi:hypothetical protein
VHQGAGQANGQHHEQRSGDDFVLFARTSGGEIMSERKRNSKKRSSGIMKADAQYPKVYSK